MLFSTMLPVPLVNQLNEANTDGHPDNNPRWNCVPASLASGATALLHRPFDGGDFKDAVYGPAYTGGQAAEHYVSYLASLGVKLTPFNGTQSQLVAEVHAQVALGHPVIITMPSQWGTPESDPVHPNTSTHVGCAAGVGAGVIRVMNPWGGFWHDGTDAYWAARFCYGQVWVMSLIGTPSNGKPLPMPIPTNWKDDGHTLTAPNGQGVVLGFRAYIVAAPSWDAANVPLEREVDTSNHSEQIFEKTGLVWDGKNVSQFDLGPVVLSARAQNADLQNQVKAAQAQSITDKAAADAANKQIAVLQAQIAQLQAEVKNGAPTPDMLLGDQIVALVRQAAKPQA